MGSKVLCTSKMHHTINNLYLTKMYWYLMCIPLLNAAKSPMFTKLATLSLRSGNLVTPVTTLSQGCDKVM